MTELYGWVALPGHAPSKWQFYLRRMWRFKLICQLINHLTATLRRAGQEPLLQPTLPHFPLSLASPSQKPRRATEQTYPTANL